MFFLMKMTLWCYRLSLWDKMCIESWLIRKVQLTSCFGILIWAYKFSPTNSSSLMAVLLPSERQSGSSRVCQAEDNLFGWECNKHHNDQVHCGESPFFLQSAPGTTIIEQARRSGFHFAYEVETALARRQSNNHEGGSKGSLQMLQE